MKTVAAAFVAADSEDPIVELRRLVDMANRRFGGRRR